MQLSVQILQGKLLNPTVISNFFFGVAGYTGEIRKGDNTFVAVEGPALVGGAIVRDGEMIFVKSIAAKKSVERMLKKANG